MELTDVETITDRLNKKADEQLTEEIKTAAQPLKAFLDRVYPGNITVKDFHEPVSVTAYASVCFDEIKALIFHNLRASYREAAIHNFLKEVNRLSEEVEELRNQINH